MRQDLPRSVFEKSGSFYLVRADGKRRIWLKLCRSSEGLPGLYLALAREADKGTRPDSVPALIAEWQSKVMPRHAEKTQRDEKARCKLVGASFVDFTCAQVNPPAVSDFLAQFESKPRTFNAYRELIRELMRFAELRGYRSEGTNPTAPIKTMRTPPRDRYITDAELARIKTAAMTGKDNKDTRIGPMLCALIDMAYLTGQRIGDLLSLEWPAIGDDGILFKPAKTRGSTGVSLLIVWTPVLREVVKTLRAFKQRNIRSVFASQTGQPYTYWGAASAWRRACARAGIKAHFHDIRAKAITDKDSSAGRRDANAMGAHSTEQQTADYIRHKTVRKTGATR